MPRWRKVWAIARKETRDIVRDRRTLFMAVVFPLILYPLLIIGLIQAAAVQTRRAEKRKPVVAVSGGRHAPELVAALTESDSVTLLEFEGSELPPKAAVGIVVPPDFAGLIAAGETAKLEILHDSANQPSRNAREKLLPLIDDYSRSVLAGRLEEKGLDEDFIHPVSIEDTDIATPRQRGVFQLGKILAFLLVTFCMMGALYPALDAISGEKERGTLETLLSIPATRLEILSGKYIAVFGMSVASVVANFVSLSATMLVVNNLMKGSSGDLPIDFTIGFKAVFLLVPALLPLAAFFSAVSLGVATYAKSAREGQYYLAPLYAAAIPLTSVALISSVNLTFFTAFVPITAISLFLKDGLLGTLAAGPAFVALLSTLAYACVAMLWAARVFSREEVLFGAPMGEGETPQGARGTARTSHVLFIWVITLILFFYLSPAIALKLGALSVPTSLIVNGILILGPALALIAVERLNWRRLFPLRALDSRAAVSLMLFIPAALSINIVGSVVQQFVLRPPAGLAGALGPSPKESIWTLLLTIALIPAVFEELFYRGFVFRSLLGRLTPKWAIVLSALLFAGAHVNPYQLIPLFALGVMLALAMRANGTLLVPMGVHFANNVVTICINTWGAGIGEDWGPSAQITAFTVLLTVGVLCGLAAWRVGRGTRGK